MAQSGSFTDILHPISVHFPIALAITGFFLAVIYLIWKKDPALNYCCRFFLWFATLGALAALVTSNYTPNLTGKAAAVEGIHHAYATWTTIFLCLASVVYLLISLYRKPLPKWIPWVGFVAYFLGALFVGCTGYYGGYIVYNVLL